jgi:phosphatidylethanolamine/phosphatidyl-N-methylethanolamine N-methyltransferase
MSAILFRRFLARPFQVAYVLPSSKGLVRRVLDRIDFQKKVFVEFGAGEGCYTREFVKRMAPDARLLVFELDSHLADHLRKQFRNDARVLVFEQDAATFREELQKIGCMHADYVISGIPFSYLDPKKKKQILHEVHDGLSPDGQFIVYQLTPELKLHTRMFAAHEVEYYLASLPPMFIVICHKSEITLCEKKMRRQRKVSKRAKAAA